MTRSCFIPDKTVSRSLQEHESADAHIILVQFNILAIYGYILVSGFQEITDSSSTKSSVVLSNVNTEP